MANENRSYVAIPASVITSITNSLNAIQTALAPYVTPLTLQERHDIYKMSDKSVTFVSKAHDYADSNPEFLPAFVAKDDFDIDFDNINSVGPLAKLALQVANNLNDTAMVAGSEAFLEALAYYNNVKLGDKNGIAGARTIYQELQKRYPGRVAKPATTPAAPTTPTT